MHFKCAKNFFPKYCGTMFFAHIGYAVALKANRNKIVFRFLKSSFKISKTREIIFANFGNVQKKLHGETLIP